MNISEEQRVYLWSRGASSFEDLQSPMERLEFANRAAQPDPTPTGTEAFVLKNDSQPFRLSPTKIQGMEPRTRMGLNERLERIAGERLNREAGRPTMAESAYLDELSQLQSVADAATALTMSRILQYYGR